MLTSWIFVTGFSQSLDTTPNDVSLCRCKCKSFSVSCFKTHDHSGTLYPINVTVQLFTSLTLTLILTAKPSARPKHRPIRQSSQSISLMVGKATESLE